MTHDLASKMRVLVALESHFLSHGGRFYSENLGYDTFWKRYLMGFDEVLVLGRCASASRVPPTYRQACGPRVQFAPVPDFYGVSGWFQNRRSIRTAICEAIDRADAFILRVPGFLGTLCGKRLNGLGQAYGVEVVGDPWDSLAPGCVQSKLRPMLRYKAWYDLRRLCRLACTSAYVTSESLQKRYPCSPNTFTTHYSSVELPDESVLRDPAPRQVSLASLKQRVSDSSQSPIRLGFIGTFEALYKDPETHLRAVAELIRRGANVQLRLAGDGKYLGVMQQLSQSLGIEAKTQFLGRLSPGKRVFEFLDETELFLNASIQEGLPRAMIEAMSRGCPVVASTVGGIPELVAPQFLVPPGDQIALAYCNQSTLSMNHRLGNVVEHHLALAGKFRVSVLNERRALHYQTLAQRSS
ncbi:MAG: glycosyltransferase [Planctomycetota bacterium]